MSLGTTPGLRRADEAFAELARGAGVKCEVVKVAVGRAGVMRRQSTVTDIVEARAARKAASGVDARVVVYSTVTAGLMQKPPGPYAVRFDSTAASNRPGLSGTWQRRREAKLLAGARVLLPWGSAAMRSIPAGARGVPAVPLHVPVDAVGAVGPEPRDLDAVAYCGYPQKRGLDILVKAWQTPGVADGRRLVITGIERERAREWLRKRDIDEPAGVEWAGLLDASAFRSTLGRARLFVNASRREDHGLSQLEALAAGAVLVTAASEGPYEALTIATALDSRLVADAGSPQSLASAIQAGFDVDASDYSRRARQLIAPYRRDAIRDVFEQQVLPALGLR